MLGGQMVVLSHYPLQKLDIPASDASAAAVIEQTVSVTEAKEIKAKYRVTKKDCHEQSSFAPVQRVHRLNTGELTELVDIHRSLNDKLRRDFGGLEIGDEKEFTLGVQALTVFRPRQRETAGGER